MFILHARIVIPLDSAAIVDGAVALDGPLIVGCGRYREILSRFGPADEIDLTDCVLLPGLVNAHTHLELSYLKGEVPYRNNFIQWVDSLRELRSQALPSQLGDGTFERIMNHACRESVQGGVTTVGDISYEHRAWHYLSRQPLRKTCFAEVFGMTGDLDTPGEYLRRCIARTRTDELLRLGLSPHAPYSAASAVYGLSAELAAENFSDDSPISLTTHLAETVEESVFLLEGTGPWLDYLKRINKWDGSFICPGQSPVNYFLSLDLADQPFLLAHVNYITDDELTALARAEHSVVFCPRSHYFFNRPAHSFRSMLEAGVNVCLGTDSLASNDSLSILDEMRFLHEQYPDFSVETLLKMGTINGAAALGWQDKVGRLTVGMEADLTAVPLTGDNSDPLTDILESNTRPQLTIVRGKIVYHIT